MTQPGARVVVTTEGPVATITMTAPERLNAVDPAMLEELTAGGRGSSMPHPAVRVIAITGGPRLLRRQPILARPGHHARQSAGRGPQRHPACAGRLVRAISPPRAGR